jgi:small subunit ribosomal protein S20
MPIIKSAIKRARQASKRRSHNLQVKRLVHHDIRAFEGALNAGKTEEITKTLREAISEIDRAVKKGTLHKNTASRRKSNLSKKAMAVASKPGKKTTKA